MIINNKPGTSINGFAKVGHINFIKHAEKYLGNIDGVWKDNDSNENIQVISFNNSPCEEYKSFVTIGLNNHILHISESKKIRHELIYTGDEQLITSITVNFLFYICEYIIKRHKALLRGEVINLPEDVSRKVGFYAVYCVSPICFDDEFSIFKETSPDTIIVWLIPVFKSEAEYIDGNGWGKFEDILEEKDPDLCSLNRKPVI